jgi:hypothetical protein
MLTRPENGPKVDIPKTRNGAIVNGPASRSDLTAALAAAERTAIKTAAVARNAQPLTAPQAGWPIIGEACNDDHSWCDISYELVGEACQPSCQITDVLAGNLTVDPSATGKNRVTWTVLYSPNGGNFAGYHWQWFVLKFQAQNQCGTGNSSSYSYSFSNTFTTNCDTELWSSRNTTAVAFWAFFTPYGAYLDPPQKGRDGEAVCMAQSTEDPVCLY